jgi:hypothetical protein
MHSVVEKPHLIFVETAQTSSPRFDYPGDFVSNTGVVFSR